MMDIGHQTIEKIKNGLVLSGQQEGSVGRNTIREIHMDQKLPATTSQSITHFNHLYRHHLQYTPS